ncbi:hypothetical protein CHUAL_014266 [Chamberlinius hualienensis]
MKFASYNDDSKEILSFRDSIKQVINFLYFYGIDIRKQRTYHFICNVLFAVHLFLGSLFLSYAFLKADLQNEDMQVFVWSAGLLTLAIQNVVMKISYRWSNKDLVKLLAETDAVLEMFPKISCQQYLQKLKQMSNYILVLPFSFLVIQVSRQIEIYCFSERTVINYGSPLFRYLQQNYYIDDIFRIGIAMPCYTFFLTGTAVLCPVLFTVFFMIQNLKRINDAEKYIKIHRRICNYYKLTQNAFGLFFFLACGTILVVILFFARSVATSPRNISWSALLVLAIYFPILMVHIVFIGKTNIELETTLSQLMNSGDNMRWKMRKLGPNKRSHLLSKLDLYVTFVALDRPQIELIGIGKVKPQIVIGIVTFVLCYTFVLYDK